MYRPLHSSDIELIQSRVNSCHPECNVPVREDVTLTNGDVIKGLLTWGHPNCYKLTIHNGKVYACREWDIGKAELFGE